METPVRDVTPAVWRWLRERERAVPCCICLRPTFNNGAACDRHKDDQ